MLSLELVGELGKAQTLAIEGKKNEALKLAKKVEKLFEDEKHIASHYEIIQTLAGLAKVYYYLKSWPETVDFYEEVCELNEKYEPGTTATAGDYWILSIAYENLGDIDGALRTMKKSYEHCKHTTQFERYRRSYESRLGELLKEHPNLYESFEF